MREWSEGDVYANGINIHYHRSDGDNKPSILLLHGITDSGLCWSRVAHDLEGNYDVIMTDARDHGHSGTSAMSFSIALLADDAAAVIRTLNLEKPYLFGHSMGAITAASPAPSCSLRAILSQVRLSRPKLPRKQHGCGSVVRWCISAEPATTSIVIAMMKR